MPLPRLAPELLLGDAEDEDEAAGVAAAGAVVVAAGAEAEAVEVDDAAATGLQAERQVGGGCDEAGVFCGCVVSGAGVCICAGVTATHLAAATLSPPLPPPPAEAAAALAALPAAFLQSLNAESHDLQHRGAI